MKHNSPFDCREYSRELESFADGELSDARIHDIKNHLQSCESCCAKLREIERDCAIVKSALGSFPRIAPSADFDLRVLAKLEARRQSPLLDFCDRLDAVFSRPLPKILGSSFLGMFFGLVLVLPLLLHASAPDVTSPNVQPRPELLAEQSETRADFSLYALGRFGSDAELMRALTRATKRRARKPQPVKEPSWNDDYSLSPRSFSRGSLC